MGDVQVRDKLYIDGAWVASSGSNTIDVVNSTTEAVMGTIPEGTPDDVDRAVKAAKAAFTEARAAILLYKPDATDVEKLEAIATVKARGDQEAMALLI